MQRGGLSQVFWPDSNLCHENLVKIYIKELTNKWEFCVCVWGLSRLLNGQPNSHSLSIILSNFSCVLLTCFYGSQHFLPCLANGSPSYISQGVYDWDLVYLFALWLLLSDVFTLQKKKGNDFIDYTHFLNGNDILIRIAVFCTEAKLTFLLKHIFSILWVPIFY